ncbi:MAG: hypothetical protein WCO18_02265 [bacterium]
MSLDLADFTISQYLASEFGFKIKPLPGKNYKRFQEANQFELGEGSISLSVVKQLVETYYTKLDYELSGLNIYTKSFDLIAESTFEKIQIECTLIRDTLMELSIMTLE